MKLNLPGLFSHFRSTSQGLQLVEISIQGLDSHKFHRLIEPFEET